MKKPHIVIIGAGVLQLPAIKNAIQLGYAPIVVDENPLAPGMYFAEIPVVASTHNNQVVLTEIIKLSHTVPIHGVFTAGTDRSLIVALIADCLKLPGITPQAAFNCSNKMAMRSVLHAAGIPLPLFFLAKTKEEAIDAFHSIPSQQAVIKPLDNMGARGVKQIFSQDDVLHEFNQTAQFSSDNSVLIEELLIGEELSIDSLVFNNILTPCGIADRLIERAPYFIEIGHVLPSQKTSPIIQDAVEMLEKGAKTLGINLGAAKGDIKITSSGARIVEIAARLSGGFMSGFTFPYATGINLIKCALKLAVGQIPTKEELTPTQHSFSIEKGILPPQKGAFKKVENIQKALNIPFIKNIFITAQKNKKIEEITSNVDKIGHIIANAPTLEEAHESCNEALNTLKIIME